MYDKDKKEIRRSYTAIAAYGWKTWGDNVPTVKLAVSSFGTGAEQNLTEEEVMQVVEMLLGALKEAKEAKDHENADSGWEAHPF